MPSIRPRILVMIDHYLPGHKVGGPARSVANLIDRLSDDFDFWVVTRDRDWLDSTPYSSVTVDTWTSMERSMVYYASARSLSRGRMVQIIEEVCPNLVYLNSFFAPSSARYLGWRRARLLPEKPVVLAPRGQFSPGALTIKSRKKQLYLRATSRLGFLRGLVWQASSHYEEHDIRACLGNNVITHIAPNLPTIARRPTCTSSIVSKNPGELRIVFLSRISPKKNLHFALELLDTIRGRVTFDLYGPADPEAYWQSCRSRIAALPANVSVKYCGSLANERVAETLSAYHFSVLPTLGENFGHSIFESFSAGCPALISDQTPWRNLQERSLGWDLPLQRTDRWRSVLQECVDMDSIQHNAMRIACETFANDWINSSGAVDANAALFQKAIEPKSLVAPRSHSVASGV